VTKKGASLESIPPWIAEIGDARGHFTGCYISAPKLLVAKANRLGAPTEADATGHGDPAMH
jgi:hypothetical protein